ncbi:Protein of unknown function DUF1475, partial [Cynara cardunculus var. scolymus]
MASTTSARIVVQTLMFVLCIVMGAAFAYAWFVYKESNWTVAAAIIASTWLVGSITTCGYIFVQFFKLSPEESSTNPLYFVDHVRISVVTARVIVSALGCLMVGVLIYSFIVNASSPYHSNPVARCMVATVIDIYIHHVVLSVWVAYKEPSFISAFFWIVLLLCFGSSARRLAIYAASMADLLFCFSISTIALKAASAALASSDL